MAFYIKQNDSSPSIRAALKDGDNIPIDLEGATVRFHMKALGETTLKVDAVASVVSPAVNGIVQYDWDNGDTDTVGSYRAEFEVTFAGGAVETFPNSDYLSVIVKSELD